MPVVTWRRGIDRKGVNATTSKFDTLRSTVELGGCSTAELRSLLQYFDEVTVPAGTRLAVKGQQSGQFVIVANGRLKAGSPDQGWHRLLPGDSAGWAAMWEMAPNEATVVAETEARLLVMGHAQFRAIKALVRRPMGALAEKRFLRAVVRDAVRESPTAVAR
jgi:CRP-like cAMP-binding protein